MVAILVHVTIKPDRTAQFEAIERDLAAATHANEPDCLRYECWRAAAPNSYYVLLAFRNAAGFYTHQISDWHERRLTGLYACFDDFKLEFIDPVQGASGAFPPTLDEPPPGQMSAREAEYRQMMPVVIQQWWTDQP